MSHTKKFEITHDKLLKAAHSLFTEQGFNHTGVSDIVKRAGYSTGIFYKHYKSKSEILTELWRQFVETSCLQTINCVQESNTLEEAFESILLLVKEFRSNPIYKYYSEARTTVTLETSVDNFATPATKVFQKILVDILRKENPSASEIKLNTYASAIHSIIDAVAELNYSNLNYEFDETTTYNILLSLAKNIQP